MLKSKDVFDDMRLYQIREELSKCIAGLKSTLPFCFAVL